MTKRAAMYCRVSVDAGERGGKSSESPEQQQDVCRRLIESRGWTLTEVYTDRDISAYDRDALRPDFEAMMAAVRSGEVDVVVARNVDRFGRRVKAMAALVDELDQLGVSLVTVDGIDSSSAAGRVVVHLLSSVAEMESSLSSERRMAKNAYNARNGKYVKGGRRSWGRELDGTVIESEAEVIRQVADYLLDGVGLTELANALNESRNFTPAGNRWIQSSLSRSIREPHLRGIRRHVVRVDGRRVIEHHPGKFKAILDEATGLRLVEILGSRQAPERAGAAHLLTGLAVCGVCGCKLGYGTVRHPRGPDGPRFPKYSCRPGDGPNCGKIQASERSVDLVVRDAIIENLTIWSIISDEEITDIGDRRIELQQQITEDTQAIEDLTHARYVERFLGDQEYRSTRLVLDERIAQTQNQLKTLMVPKEESRFDWFLGHGELTWDTLYEPAERKRIVRSLVEKVIIHPVKRRGGNIFDPSRVEVIWRPGCDAMKINGGSGGAG
jgi:DNA invertase Pin-like site-specific DNA recombinase